MELNFPASEFLGQGKDQPYGLCSHKKLNFVPELTCFFRLAQIAEL